MIRRQVVVFCHTSHCQPSELLPDEARREREDGRLIGPLSLHAESPCLWQATGKKRTKTPGKVNCGGAVPMVTALVHYCSCLKGESEGGLGATRGRETDFMC